MKNIYFKSRIASPKFLIPFLMVLLGSAFAATAQVRVPFTQRTSQYTPTKTIYNIKGDFTMMGNTNLTLQNYGEFTQNGNNTMRYVDVDAANATGIGGTPTFNSSSATLSLSTENGAVPSCSNIIYAGLYWTGRSANSSPSANVFSVTKSVQTGTTSVNVNQTVNHDQDLNNSSYHMTVSRSGNNGNRYPVYTFSGGGSTYAFSFTNGSSNAVSVSINGGSGINVPATYSSSGGFRTATFTTPYVISDGGVNITINSLRRDNDNNLSTSDTQSGASAQVNIAGTTATFSSVTKEFNKRKIQFKGPGASGYTEFTANTSDIYYPTTQDDYMYSAYAEVTDYVRTHGIGEYTAADIALIEGNGGGTGYYGGWGLIVVYENSKMRYRDVTVFDGHAYVIGGDASNNLPISGFNTVQAGSVGIKLGLMAGEGDNGISGDYFQIQRQDNGQFQSLSHSANSATNFFNSSIQTAGARNPNLVNNTGLDISMFNLPNANNALITNNQTSTTFKYGSTQDTYIIFAVAMAVDAYIPEMEGNLSAVTINGNPVPTVGPYTALPGQEMEFKIQIRNRGTEPINNARITIPIPYNTDYVANSANRQVFFTPVPSPNSLVFNPALGSNGSIVWDIGTLPVPSNPDTLLGELRFKVTVTTDCELLKNTNCNNVVALNGSLSGTGAITGIPLNDKDLIQGYTTDGACQGTAIAAPLLVNVNATEYVNLNCQSTPPITAFTFCSTGTSIPITMVSGSFPNGSTFFNQYPVTANAIQYTISNPFPATVGTSTYYAVPPGALQGCYFQFTITVTTINSTPVVNGPINYCQNAVAQPLTATPSSPGLMLFYYTSQNGAPQVSITPSTANVGSTTYYVAEAASATCIGPKVPIVVNVFPAPQVNAPAAQNLNGCGPDVITTLAYSMDPVTITLAQFIAAGGSIPNSANVGDFTISYSDVRSGNCPVTVTRTFTVTSACGTTTATQTISIMDTTPPVIAGLPTTVQTLECPAVPVWATPSATDNCEGIVTLTSADTTTENGCGGSYTITRTWTATDLCGNVATASQSYNIVDTTAPVIAALPEPSTISCPATPQFVQATATDSCSPNVTLTFSDEQTPGSCGGSYTVVRTWTATDACGNTATATQTISVQDNSAPVAPAAPADVTVSCGADVPANVTLTATDDCGASISVQGVDVTTAGTCAGSYTIVRTWTFTDACGNSSSVSQTITVNDDVAPVAPSAPADVNVACAADVPANVTLTATDNCQGAITAEGVDVTTPGACANSFVIVRTWTFADACGNSSSVSQTINVNDNIAPVAPSAPADVNVACAADVPANVSLTAQDNCQGAITAEGIDVTTPGSCPNSFVIVRTWTFADACGNSSSVSQTINVNDNIAPVAPSAPADVNVACAANVPANVSLTATDNCQGAITAEGVDVTTPGSCPNSFVIVRTWTFADACGNSSSVSQTINVNDNIAPVAPSAPADVNVACAADVPANVTLTATDNCQGAITAEGVDVTTPGSCPNSFVIVRTWTFTDACGNSSSVSQTINVNDNIAPVAPEAPADVTVACAGDVPASVTLTATDNCSGAISAEGVDVTTPGACANSFTIVRTWTFADACGNSSSVSQTITVNDDVAPVISELPAASTIDCPATPSFATPTATDNCAGEVTLAFEDVQTAGACAGSYTIVRTWTATDVCGNSSTATQAISVQDVTAPVITAQASNLAIQCGTGNENALNDWLASNGGATATDACSEVTWTNDYDGIGNDCSAAVTVTFTATDACGNASTTSATFTVSDTTAPVAPQAPADVTVQCASEVPANPTLTATDNCAGTIQAEGVDVTTPGACAGSYTIVRTWTFTDACANSSSVSQTITVNDTTAPVAPEAPATLNLACAGDVPANVSLTAQDNCQGAITAEGVDVTTPGSCPNSFVIVRTWTFADACGNSSSVSQTINVNDNIAPVAPEAPADVTASCGGDIPANVTLTATDNCSGAISAEGVDVTTPGACAGSYTIVRTWTFTDECGNASSVSQTITVDDTTAPVAPEAPADVTVACAGDVPASVTLTATDNCSGAISAEGVDVTTPGACANSFTIVRTWTFADACGNSSSVSQTITVNDDVAPVISELPAASTIDCPATPSFATPTATDNCAGEVTLAFEDVQTAGACAGSYTIVRTWTATDVCGNSSTATQAISVQDVTAPVITAQASNLAIQCGAGNENALNDWLASNGGATATDACSEVTWTNNYNGIGNDCSAAVTVTFTATDACGNASTTSATFTVSDTTAPVAPQAPADVTVQCASEVPANPTLTATDNCAGTIQAEGVDVTTPGACAGSYTIVRTWTFTDACANSSSVSQTITVNDTTAPVAPEAPATLNLACAGDVPANVSLTAQDNCQGAITAEGVDVTTPGSCPNSFVIVRTWTFADACGNSSSVSQTINVNDNIAPVAPEAPADVTASCGGDIPANVTLTATDNCSGAISAEGVDVTTPGACAGSYTIVRTWTFTDECGNASSVSQTITVDDTTAPVAPEAPADVTVACAGDVPASVTLTATDNCSGAISAEGVDVTTPGACANSFTIVRTWTFADACGNSSSVSQTITVNDDVAPVISELPAASTIDCPATPSFATPTATDNCAGEVTLAFEDVQTAGACAGSYTIVRTWTATDVCGNSSTATQAISVQDVTAPVITAQASNLAIQCGAGNENALNDWLASNGGATATDACSEVTWTNDYDGIGNDCSAAVTVTFTATDACGNASTTSATFTVSDTTAPVAPQAPADVTVQCASEVPANPTLTATDNCAGTIQAEGVDVTTPGACAGSYTIVRTWTFTDACANSSSVSQTITVNDTTAPVAPEAPADLTLNCGDAVPASETLVANDNCGDTISATGVDVETAGDCPGTSTIVRTWTFTDACGNSSSVSQTINIIDTVAPVVPAAPADITVACASEVPAAEALTAVDACSGNVTGKATETVTPGSCPNSYVIVRTWNFTDACGNTSSVSQTITVNDTVPPVMPTDVPADLTVSCATDVPAAISLTTTDNCGGTAITVNAVDSVTAGSCANSYVITRSWTFTDLCGNTTVATQTITVNDTTAPTFVEPTPAGIDVSCDAIPAAATLTATDNCDSASVPVIMTESTTPGACSGTYTLTRTWTATDACGNSASVSQVINVMDISAPVFVEALPQDITVECGSVPSAAVLTATDNCSATAVPVMFTETSAPGKCPVVETITRTWIAEDGCGNQVSHVQVISVQDTTAPVADITLDPVVNVNCDAIPAVPVLTFSDSCSAVMEPSFTETISDVSNGTYSITWNWIVADLCGNQATFTQVVNVTIADSELTVSDAQCNGDSSLSIDLTTLLPAGTPAGGSFVNVDGILGLNGNILTPYQTPNGVYTIDYVIADAVCPRTVHIEMTMDETLCEPLAECEPFVHNAFTPNNDGINEVFFIENFGNTDCIVSNNVEIYNRWGVLVFEKRDYNNEDRAFRGVSEGRVTLDKGAELPTGTYFFIISWKKADGTSGNKQGYLYLSR